MADEPIRTLDKQEATRHLIHAAIRMFSEEEDPFAIHVLIHAAENTLIDVAKKSGKPLRVKDIMTANIITLFICISNYGALFNEWTNHMVRFYAFVLTLRPYMVTDKFPRREEFLQGVRGMQTTIIREFLRIADQNNMLPIHTERAADLKDIGHFYNLTFEELRDGKKRSPRIHPLPIY